MPMWHITDAALCYALHRYRHVRLAYNTTLTSHTHTTPVALNVTHITPVAQGHLRGLVAHYQLLLFDANVFFFKHPLTGIWYHQRHLCLPNGTISSTYTPGSGFVLDWFLMRH